MPGPSPWIRIQVTRAYGLKPPGGAVRRLEPMLISFIKRGRNLVNVSLTIVSIMSRCDHISLLRIAEGKEVCLLDDDRLDRAMQPMTNPSAQYPSLQFFIGRKAKDLALPELFPHNNVRRGHQDRNCVANLRLDASSISCNRPILFADSDPLSVIYRNHEAASCHRTTSYPVPWAVASDHSLYDILHARLFFLFTDVICIFADDFKDHGSVTDRLNTWATIGSASDLPREIRPRVVIVASDQVEKLRGNKQSWSTVNTRDSFSSIELLYLPGDYLSPLARYHRLKDTLLRQADEIRWLRINKHYLLSAVHMSRLFSQALQHTVNSVNQPFSFIRASREGNEITEDYSDHLLTFFKLGARCEVPYSSLISFVASSILMDAYPPNMHSGSLMITWPLLSKLTVKQNSIRHLCSTPYIEHLASKRFEHRGIPYH